ncbi:calcium-transporting ATPase 12, plasma membrane-type-like [Mangifera indica]|uniref:calcium-transporting ATPase 12, plasma membrane-type-like n=1 Tax=Mangifera indica TaxID=29780 RepID=UPI001CFAB4BD|nr:calcium-transporting ATPase 12, plasma membrane-type-like [Mangifera indica]
MFNNDQGCGSGDILDPGLLITTTNTSSNINTCLSRKYARLWRRTITVTVLISLNKTNSPEEDLLHSPTSSSPLITHQTNSNSLEQEDTNTHNSGHENGVVDFVLKTYNSFSRRSFKNQDGSASTSSYAPVPASPTADQGLGRNLSTQSRHAIDIPSDSEVEEKSEQQKRCDYVVQIVKERNLDSLKAFGGVQEVASAFGSHLENGKGDVQGPEEWYDDNAIPAKGFLYFFSKASISLTNLLLLVSAALSFATGIMKQGAKYGWHDGVAILAAVSLLVTVPSVGNFCRARKLEKLCKEKNKLKVEVVRSGKGQFITVSNLVAGDIVHLKEGDQIPADGLVVRSNGLVLDDVLNPKIDGDHNPFLFYGSRVKQGNGAMLVTSVGYNRTLAKLMRLVISEPDEKPLLEARIEKPSTFMENLSLFVSLLIALVALIRLLHEKHDGGDDGLPELKGNVRLSRLIKMFGKFLLVPQGKIRVLASALAVAVIAIQHGMPFAITNSLYYWNEKLKRSQAKPQNLSACATIGLGMVTVLCIDATGGLVCNDMEVNKFWIGENDLSDDVDFEIDQAVFQSLKRGIGASVLVPGTSVSPSNNSFVSWAELRWNSDVEFLDRNISLLQYKVLSSGKKGCGMLLQNNGDEKNSLHMHWSGAASTILDMCSHYYDSKGNSHAISVEKSKFQKVIKDMEDGGLRPVAFACRQTDVEEIRDDGLHLLALAGLKYSCPEEIKLEVKALRMAGVRIVLLSEEELSAVKAIGCELGILRPEANDVALDGEQIRDLDPSQRAEKINYRTTVIGNCLPEDKFLVVQSMQQKGQIVAFFGGSSSNDTPALKQADVGITDDSKGTTLATESADIVIKGINSLHPAVKLGRCAYHNIQKFTQLQMTVSVSGLLITFVTTMSIGVSPISTLQLIWVTCIVCLLGSRMMVMELQSEELLKNPPGQRTESLLTKVAWKNIVIQVLCQAFVVLIFQFMGQGIPSLNQDTLKPMIFNTFTLCQVFDQLNAMGLIKKKVHAVVVRNYKFLVAFGTVLVLQVVVVEFMTSLAGCEKLNGVEWGVCFILAAISWGLHCAVNNILHSLLNRRYRSGFPSRQHWHNLLRLIIPNPMFVILSITYHQNVI